MGILAIIALVLFAIGIAFAVKNGDYAGSTTWFLTAIALAVVSGAGAFAWAGIH